MNDPTVFVDFLDVNKIHRKKIYQHTRDYNRLANVLNEFQMKLGSKCTEVRTYGRTHFMLFTNLTGAVSACVH